METLLSGLLVALLAGSVTGVWKALWQALRRSLTPPPPPSQPHYENCTFIYHSTLTAGANVNAGGLPPASQPPSEADKPLTKDT